MPEPSLFAALYSLNPLLPYLGEVPCFIW